MENSSAQVKVDDTSAKPSEQAKQQSLLLPVILVLVGMLVMAYPVISTAWNNYGQQRAASEYNKLEQSVPQQVQDYQWENAHAYNEGRETGPILDPWLNRISDDNPEYAQYLNQLNATDVMARLIFPTIKTDLPVYHGTDDKTLQKGLGHLYGSDLPVGGEGTHSIITGHTGLSNATLFDNLNKAKEGDAFYIQVAGHKLKYVVDQIKVVLPHETGDLKPVAGQDYITLITCTPYGINTHRLLVRGHQVPLDEADAEIFDKNNGAGWQWWMYALLAAVLVVGGGLLWWLWRQHNKHATNTTPATNTAPDADPAADTKPAPNTPHTPTDDNHEETLDHGDAPTPPETNTPNNPNNTTHPWWETNND